MSMSSALRHLLIGAVVVPTAVISMPAAAITLVQWQQIVPTLGLTVDGRQLISASSGQQWGLQVSTSDGTVLATSWNPVTGLPQLLDTLASKATITTVFKNGVDIPIITLNADVTATVFQRPVATTGGGTEVFSIGLQRGLTFDPDPQINLPFSVQNRTGTTQNYAFSFTMNLLPALTPVNSPQTLVKSNLTGTLRDGNGTANNGDGAASIGLVGGQPIVRSSVTQGLTQVPLGVDVGNAQSFSGVVGAVFGYTGQFNAGPDAGPYKLGPSPVTSFTQMTQTVNFSLSAGDRATMVAFTEIMPIPEPGTYGLMLAGLGVVAAMARRRGRRAA